MLARAASTAVARGTSSRALCVCLSAPRAVRAASSVAALSAAAARRAGRATAGDDAWQRTASAALSSKKGRRLDELGARVYFTTSARARRQEQSTTRTDSAESAAPAASESAQAATAPAAKEDKEVERGGAAEKVSLGELRRLGGLAWPERRTIGIALGLLTVSSSVSLAVPFAVGRIIDVFSGQAAPGLGALGPAAAAGVLAGIFAAGALANVGRTILMRLAGQRIVMRLRENAYANVLSLDMAWHDLQATQPAPVTTSAPTATTPTPPPSPKEEAQPAEKAKDDTDTRVRSTGDVLSRLGADSSIVGDALTRELGDGLRAVVTAVVGTGAMFLISAKLTLVALLIVPPLALAAVFYGRFIKRLARQTQRSVGDMVALADERLGAIRTVHAFNQTRAEHRRFAARTSRIFELARKEAYASGLFFGGAGFSGNVTLLALLSYGGMLVAGGELTVGALTSLLVYAFYIGSSLVSLSSFFGTLMKGLGASSRVFALLDARPVRVSLHSPGARTLETTRRGPGVLALENVTFRYPARAGAAPVLRDVSLRIEPGTSLAIAGASGSGKSTIAHLLARFYDPDQGRVTHDGEDIRDFTLESWRQQVAVIPQNPILFSGTIAENIAYGRPDAPMSEIELAAQQAHCDFIADLPHGFSTLVGSRTGSAQLSGGQVQRLAIARALLVRPRVLVADEATSALDAESEALVNDALRLASAQQGITTIVIAHRLSTLRTAKEIVLLEQGSVVERGNWLEIAKDGTRFQSLNRSQMLEPAAAAPAVEQQ